MEKKQYDLCLEILRRFHKEGILDNFVLIGSWCVFFYKDYFSASRYIDHIALRTRDIDFLIGTPNKIKKEVDVPALLKDLGFIVIFKGEKGYVKLDHPDLILEFLVPERGRGIDGPYKIPALSINATALRFLDFLLTNTIKVKVENFYLTLPHPANFALHKLIIFQRRAKEDKALKDKNTAIAVLKALVDKDETNTIKSVFSSVHRKWQNKIIKGLEGSEEIKILEILQKARH
ncbi:MAG: GSU2403 family nucleotidyltransferase fold protein [Candidatus Omnitrophota bacterium]